MKNTNVYKCLILINMYVWKDVNVRYGNMYIAYRWNSVNIYKCHTWECVYKFSREIYLITGQNSGKMMDIIVSISFHSCAMYELMSVFWLALFMWSSVIFAYLSVYHKVSPLRPEIVTTLDLFNEKYMWIRSLNGLYLSSQIYDKCCIGDIGISGT